MSEFTLLSKYGALSCDRFVPTPIAVPRFRYPGHESGETCISVEPIQTPRRGNSAVIGTSPVPRSAGKSLSSAPFVTSASTSKDARNYCRHPPRTCRTSAGAFHRGRFTLDGPDNPRIVEPGDRADTNDLHLDGT